MRTFFIRTTLCFSPLDLLLLNAIIPLTGLTFIKAALASEFVGASGEFDFFLIILRKLLLKEIFAFGFGLPSPLELTIGYALGFKLTKLAFKILRF